MLPELSHEDIHRYSYNILITDIGQEGQRKLKAASVLVVGVGGLGSSIAIYLAAAGIGRIGLLDHDLVELSNLQRQIIHSTSRLGDLKVESARDRLLELNPDIRLEIYNEYLNPENAFEIAESYDIIMDGTDNFPTRYLINDLCVLTGKPFIYGSVYRFDGQASVLNVGDGPCYRCLFPEPPPPDLVPSTAEGGVLSMLPGTIGTIQATEALKLILGIGEPLIGRLLLYDCLDLSIQTVRLKKNPDCKVCGATPEITTLIDYEEFCGYPSLDHQEGSTGEQGEITPQ